ncbi:chloride conductance regulatory protein ICln [Lotus japonicus]|uniref:chloride conductance regulatory protein ICln n=1 Tax=Lotus japonicus TaxID=34305 RepID=UPI002587D01A|nr:chloride conductance regulatory protein ICln [Lotus japonicus]
MVYGVREINVSRSGSGSGSGGEPVNLIDTENGESLMRVQPGVDLVLSNLPPHSPGSGTLYVTTKQVIWVSDLDQTKGFAVDFLSISLHAVSRDPDAYPLPCLYTQIETEDDLHSNDSDSESNNHALDLSTVREMRLIPSDPTQLDSLFQTFCDCAELNPEPNAAAAAAEEEGQQHNWIFSADQMEDDEQPEEEGYIAPNLANSLGHSNGDHDLARTVLELQINDQRFEDAEEVEHDGDGTHH